MVLGGLIPLEALVDFQTPLFLVWWLIGWRQLSANLWVSTASGLILAVVGRGRRWVLTWVSSFFVVARDLET